MTQNPPSPAPLDGRDAALAGLKRWARACVARFLPSADGADWLSGTA